MRKTLRATCCALAAALAAAVFAGDELSLGAREGVLLLTNGELLAGTIIPAGDRYDVHLETGEIRIRRSEVAMVCRDARECYLHKRSGIEIGRAADHLALAEWCLRNGLLAEGEKELGDARAADAAHPKIRLIASRLELATAPPPPAAEASPEKPVAHTPLDSVARHLPTGAMESFTNTVQPLLLNYCSKGGCHSSRDDGGLKLERIHPKLSGRTATQRNLQSVLALIDRQNPSQSKLLQAPIRPHGTVQAAIFTDRQQSQYRQLVQWVYTVAGSRMPLERPSLEERTAPLLQTVPGATGAVAHSDGQSSDAAADPLPNETLEGDAGAVPESQSDLPLDELPPADAPDQTSSNRNASPQAQLGPGIVTGKLPGRIQRGAIVAPAFAPKDEFDPAIFNRRFFGG